MSLLSLNQVNKRFGGLRALTDISLDVEEGEILGLMGANGAGKTTLFSVICGHARPSSGEIRLGGESIVGLRPDQVCRRGIARTFQIVKPFGQMTVMENLLTAAMFGPAAIRRRDRALGHCREVLDELGMGDAASQPAHSLTLAMQKKLEVARAVATGCRILMLDEVMAGLTPTEVNEMLAIIRRLRLTRRLTILIVEHVMKALMELSSRVVVLHHGELIAKGTPSEIAADENVLEVYFGRAAP
ncbi:MAG: ABC transporter ATP-binding protein [Alphaproteobacteria bacterium]|nr:ABC transporter ATP-binding protein [Alphaproteobacteria bacterium]